MIDLLVKNATVVVPGPKIASASRGDAFYGQQVGEDAARSGRGDQGPYAHRLSAYEDAGHPRAQPGPGELGRSEIGHAIIHHFRIDSTNTAAMDLAQQGAEHGTVVVAEEQTAGRGRFGRDLVLGKIQRDLLSVILRPPFSPAAAPILTLMAGVAAQQALERSDGTEHGYSLAQRFAGEWEKSLPAS